MRIAIVGAGGVGGVLGARLARSGVSVAFVARGEHLRAMRSRGLKVISPDDEIVVPKVEVSDDPRELGPSDAVFLCVKLYDLEAAARASAPLLRPDTLVVPLQNGVEADDLVKRCLPGRRILTGVAYVTSSVTAPGEIRQTSSLLKIAFGSRSGAADPRAAKLESACRGAGIDATLSRDIEVRLWEKFVFLASVSAITCLGDLRLGEIRSCDETRALLADAMREVVAVGRAHGARLADDVVDRALGVADSLPPETTSSMHHDLASGRRLEVDWLSGAVVRLGREKGIDAPIHRTAHACLKPRAGGAAKSGA
ncbi:MAG TPA: 2-dehydropantoate 2-reductase [Planctomycetota bacterium]|nr:2-dehydropantoate 2-reductase [Planctomycetota bacterium]